MKVQNLSLICAALSLAFMASCGGSGFNGVLGPRKDGGSKKENTDATEPTVTTGAYLTCDPRPSDSVGADSEAVGCSVIQNGRSITPSDSNRLQFYRVVKDSGNFPPDKSGTSNLGYAAIFNVPKSQLAKTSFLAVFANKFGVDEVTCGPPAPCKETVRVGDTPEFVQLDAAAVWRVDSDTNLVKSGARSIQSDLYCDSQGVKIGNQPGRDYCPIGVEKLKFDNPIVYVAASTGCKASGYTRIEKISQLYAPLEKLKKDPDRDLNAYFKDDDKCIIVPLKAKDKFKFNEMDHNAVNNAGDNLWHLILPSNPKNKKMVQDFVDKLK